MIIAGKVKERKDAIGHSSECFGLTRTVWDRTTTKLSKSQSPKTGQTLEVKLVKKYVITKVPSKKDSML